MELKKEHKNFHTIHLTPTEQRFKCKQCDVALYTIYHINMRLWESLAGYCSSCCDKFLGLLKVAPENQEFQELYIVDHKPTNICNRCAIDLSICFVADYRNYGGRWLFIKGLCDDCCYHLNQMKADKFREIKQSRLITDLRDIPIQLLLDEDTLI